MTDVEPTGEGRRRGRGAEATARSEALQRLKAIRSGGRRSENNGGYEIKLENPIYDTVAEDEYDLLVAKRKEEARGFIVDDDGLGYGDEGEEEDWSTAGLPPSSDESDGEGRSLDRFKKKKKVEKKERDPNQRKSKADLSAAAAMMGKQRISAMFTSSVFKNRRENDKVVKGLESESIVDDVIAKFAPDNVDRERRRRGQVGLVVNPKIPVNSVPVMVNCDFAVKEEKDLDLDLDCGVEDKRVELEINDDSVVVEMKVEPVVVKKEKEGVCTLNAKIIDEVKDPALSATAGWKEAMNGGNGDGGGGGGVVEVVKNGSIGDRKLDFELDADGVLHFYIVDAYEEFYGANMGNVYLFGKVML